eukprot:155022_1
MTHPDYTDSELDEFHMRYFMQLVFYQIMTVIQIVLVISSFVKFREQDKLNNTKTDHKHSPMKKSLKYLFVLVLSLGSLVFLLVEWYGIADFLYDFAVWKGYCD